MSNLMIRLAVVAGLSLSSASMAFAEGANTEDLNNRRSFASGQEAWEKVCSRCHLSGVGPDLSTTEHDADTIKFFVRNGYLAMPAFSEANLDDATLDDLAKYIGTEVFKGEAQ